MTITPHQALAAINHLDQACASAHIGYALYVESGAERKVHNRHLDGNLLHHVKSAANALGFDLVPRLTPQEAADMMLALGRAWDGDAEGKVIPVVDLLPKYSPLAVATDDRFADGNGTTYGFR